MRIIIDGKLKRRLYAYTVPRDSVRGSLFQLIGKKQVAVDIFNGNIATKISRKNIESGITQRTYQIGIYTEKEEKTS